MAVTESDYVIVQSAEYLATLQETLITKFSPTGILITFCFIFFFLFYLSFYLFIIYLVFFFFVIHLIIHDPRSGTEVYPVATVCAVAELQHL